MTRLQPDFPRWRSPTVLLCLLSVAMALSMSTYTSLLNNYAVERVAFTGADIGLLHTLREVPGLLAFTVVFWLYLVREQALAYVALVFLGVGTVMIGSFPTVTGLLAATVVSSIGFHYFEALQSSLALQWLDKAEAPKVLGRIMGISACASLAMFAIIYAMLTVFEVDMSAVYYLGGGATLAIAALAFTAFPRIEGRVRQRRQIVLRRRYGLYYALTFLAGGRRQVSMVFVGFLMVERFGFDAATMTLVYIAQQSLNMVIAPQFGRFIARQGERVALMAAYVTLATVFAGYAVAETAWQVIALFFVNQLFFSAEIASRTYFQKIADPADIANNAGVSSTINHLAAVFLPAVLGAVWMVSPSSVFLIGAAMASCSLVCASLIPRLPAPGNEIVLRRAALPAAE